MPQGAREQREDGVISPMPEIELCSRCKEKPHDGWPDGDGMLCQMCWEAECAEAWWAQFPMEGEQA